MRVAVAGSTGFIGSALCARLHGAGHDVLRLVRRPAAGPDELTWDPVGGVVEPARLEGVEAVVNLSGAGVGAQRWSRAYKKVIRDSRVLSTTTLATTFAGLDDPPRVFVSASGVGIYGSDRGRQVLDEDDLPGEGFLARLCVDWEAAAEPARAAGIAVCQARFGVVMHHSGGAIHRMLPFYRFGVGGSLGGGEQFWSHVALDDAVRALQFVIEEHGCVGPYNVTAPEPVSNAEFSRVLAQALRRPSIVAVPGLALRVVLGEYADEVLGSLRVIPRRLLESGFEFHHPTAPSTVEAALPR